MAILGTLRSQAEKFAKFTSWLILDQLATTNNGFVHMLGVNVHTDAVIIYILGFFAQE